MEPIQLVDQELFRLCSAAVMDGLRYVERRQSQGNIAQYHDWPELDWETNGMPWFPNALDAPLDYKDALRAPFTVLLDADETPEPNFKEEPSLARLIEYIRQNHRLAQHFAVAVTTLFRTHVFLMIGSFVDRYVHTYGTTTFTAQQFLPIYAPVEAYWFLERLDVAIVIPILLLKFEVKSADFGGGVSLAELGSCAQIARARRMPPRGYSLLPGRATRSFVFTNYSIPNDNWLAHSPSDVQTYPVETIDELFASLRIVTGYATGYAQLLLLPIGWASRYEANITEFDGANVRSYPPSFEDVRWNADIPTVNQTQTEQVGKLFHRLHALTNDRANPRLALAIQRFNSGLLRNRDEDAILDAVIALEALLSNDNQEVTHKISMRMAALSKLDGKTNPVSFGCGYFGTTVHRAGYSRC